MADKKISELTELLLADVTADDELPIVDVSTTTTKKVKVSSLTDVITSDLTLSGLSDVSGLPTDTHILIGNGTQWESAAADVLTEVLLPDYTGQAGKYLKVNVGEDGILWDVVASGDTFPSLTGNAGKVLTVNVTEDSVEWTTAAGGGVALDDINVWTAGNSGDVRDVSYSATVTLDGDLGNFFRVTLTGNVTLANPSNFPEGKSGCIWLRQDATGSRTWALGSNWKTKGATPTLSTAANSIDRVDYVVESSTRIEYTLTKGLGA